MSFPIAPPLNPSSNPPSSSTEGRRSGRCCELVEKFLDTVVHTNPPAPPTRSRLACRICYGPAAALSYVKWRATLVQFVVCCKTGLCPAPNLSDLRAVSLQMRQALDALDACLAKSN